MKLTTVQMEQVHDVIGQTKPDSGCLMVEVI